MTLAETLERRDRRVDAYAIGWRSDENVSRPSRTPLGASSIVRGGLPGVTSAIASRIALAPMSRTPTICGGLGVSFICRISPAAASPIILDAAARRSATV